MSETATAKPRTIRQLEADVARLDARLKSQREATKRTGEQLQQARADLKAAKAPKADPKSDEAE